MNLNRFVLVNVFFLSDAILSQARIFYRFRVLVTRFPACVAGGISRASALVVAAWRRRHARDC